MGCYYLLVSKNELAQRHFHKATKLDARCAAAWIGNGHAYAAQVSRGCEKKVLLDEGGRNL